VIRTPYLPVKATSRQRRAGNLFSWMDEDSREVVWLSEACGSLAGIWL